MTTDEARQLDDIGRAIDAAEPVSTASRATARRELNLYLDAIGKYLPAWFCRMVIRLRRPSRWPSSHRDLAAAGGWQLAVVPAGAWLVDAAPRLDHHIARSARAAATAASRFPMGRSPLEGVATARSFNRRMMESRVAHRDAAGEGTCCCAKTSTRSETSVHRVERLDEARVSVKIERDDAETLVTDLGLLVEQSRRIFLAELDRLIFCQLKAAGRSVEVSQIGHAKTVLLHFNSPRVSRIRSSQNLAATSFAHFIIRRGRSKAMTSGVTSNHRASPCNQAVIHGRVPTN